MPQKDNNTAPHNTFSVGGLGAMCAVLFVTLIFSCSAIRSYDADGTGEIGAVASAMRELIEENEAISAALGLSKDVES